MPMKLNLGLSRKMGEANYGSRGASVHVELEVDGSLVAEPAKLQERIRQLFGLVRASVAEELNGGNTPAPKHGSNIDHAVKGPGQDKAGGPNDPGSGQRHGNPPRPATPSQVKALYAIAKHHGLHLGKLLRERFRMDRPDDLTLREASQLIDDLRSSVPKEGGSP